MFDPLDIEWESRTRAVVVDEEKETEREIPVSVAEWAESHGFCAWVPVQHLEVLKEPNGGAGEAANEHACRFCGCRTFYLGRESWSTYAKCTNCGVESCVHDG